MPNPFDDYTSIEAIKKAYRKLCLVCHPDVRPDKEQAAEEFRELTRIYQDALSRVKVKQPRTKKNSPPAPPPPKPDKPIVETCSVTSFDAYEFSNFGEAVRFVRVSPAMLEYGGKLEIISKGDFGYTVNFAFVVPPKTKNGQTFRLKLPIGPVEITLVSERK